MNWKILDSSYPFVCPWLKVRKDVVQIPSGIIIPDFYIMESPDWVNVIAITEEGKFIVEKQYRHGIKKVCFELCAGVVDEGENPIDAAKRELLEETGYSGGEWTSLGVSCPNASGSTNYCYHFVAIGVEKNNSTKLEPTEDIKTILVDKKELMQIMQDGRMLESVMLMPLWKYFSSEVNRLNTIQDGR